MDAEGEAPLGGLVTVDLEAVEARVRQVLPRFPQVAAAYLFGSALDACRPDSDLDLGLVVPAGVEQAADFSPWGFEGLCEAALGRLDGHPFHPSVLDRRRPIFAMEALRGRLIYCADELALTDFIEYVARRFPDANRRWQQALDDVLATEAP